MNINCIICSDLFSSTDDVFITQCGHVFHHNCLLQWLERSKSCPQCRKKTTEKNIHRIYFNFLNTDGIVLDAGALQAQLDSTKFHLDEKEKESSKLKEEIDLYKDICNASEDKMSSLENKIKEKDSIIVILKEKVEYMKVESGEVSRLQKDNRGLKSKLDNLQCLQDIIDSNPSNVESIVQKVEDPKALCNYIIFLKKALVQTDSKKKVLQDKVKFFQAELHKLSSQNSEQSSELMTSEINIKYLEEKNKNLEKELSELKTSLSSNTKNKIEETVQNDNSEPLLKRKSDSCHGAVAGKKKHLSTDNSIAKCSNESSKSKTLNVPTIKDTDEPSPYLKLKYSSSTATIHQKLSLASKDNTKHSNLYILKNKKFVDKRNNTTDVNIFKGMEQKRKDLDTSYDGLGGHSKADVFPVSKGFTNILCKKPKKNKGLKKPENQNTIDNYCSQ